MAQVELVVTEPARIVALVTRDAVDELVAEAGMSVTAIVKSTSVMVEQLMRRLLAVAALLAAAARRRNGFGRRARDADGVCRLVADRCAPEGRSGGALLVRRLEHARRADHARRAGRRLRIGEPDAAGAAVREGARDEARTCSRTTRSC